MHAGKQREREFRCTVTTAVSSEMNEEKTDLGFEVTFFHGRRGWISQEDVMEAVRRGIKTETVSVSVGSIC